MGSGSRRKPGFSIDDILQQQNSESWNEHQIFQKPFLLSSHVEGSNQDYPDSTTIPRWPYFHPKTDSSTYENIYSQSLPFYQQMMSLHKAPHIMPFALGVPNTAAYFEQYGNSLDKSYPPFAAFYPHSYPAYYIPPSGSKRKGGQIRFTPQQTRSLETRFANAKYLSPEDRRHLAIQLKLSDRQVKTWFQNRRAKYRRSNNGLTGSENSYESSFQQTPDLRNTTTSTSRKPIGENITSSENSMSSSDEESDIETNNVNRTLNAPYKLKLPEINSDQ